MTTLSAGAAAGILVALMVVATADGYTETSARFVHPGETRGFNPQPDPPKVVPGDGSVRPVSR